MIAGGTSIRRAAGAALAALLCLPVVAQQPVVAQNRDEVLLTYLDALEGWRAGDTDAREVLLSAGETLCDDHARCDALEVARFYADLDRAALDLGLAHDALVEALRQRFVDAGHAGLAPGETWPALRAELVGLLEDLCPTLRTARDPAPAARAHALLARLRLSALEDDEALTSADRNRLIEAIAADIDLSLTHFARCGMITPRLEPLWIRGRLARAQDNRVDAVAHQEDCLALAVRVQNLDFRERALTSLIQLAKDVGDHAGVERYLAELAHFRDPRTSWPLAREHAASLLAADRPEASLAFLVENRPEAEAHAEEWHALLAAAYLRSGDLIAARREALALGETGEIGRLTMAALTLAEERPERTLLWLETERAAWSARARTEALVLEGEALLRLDRLDEAKGALAAALAEARAWSGSEAEERGSVIGEWLGLHAIALSAEVRAELGDPLGAASVIESAQSRELRGPGGAVDEAELQAWAARFEQGLVTWSVGADSTVCVWVRADGGAEAEVTPRGRKAWRAAVRRLREAAIGGDLVRARSLGTEIAAELLPPGLRAALDGAGIEDRLLCCLHGPLEGLPLSLLSWRGRALDQRVVPVVLPGLPSLPTAPPFTASTDWRLLGAPSTEAVAPLPGAAKELAALARRYPRAPLASGRAFRKEAFLEALASGDALHVATHMVHAPGCAADVRFAAVGLALSDGDVIGAGEILAARASSPLVVLAACETAGGRPIDAEGTHGLARAFLEAGTTNVVVTLWPIADAAGETFARLFHEELTRRPEPALALRDTKLRMAREGLGPEDWGAFRLLGRE